MIQHEVLQHRECKCLLTSTTMLGVSSTAGKPTASNCSIKTCRENDRRLDMRDSELRPAPSILQDSCFELIWLSSAAGNRCSRSKPVVRHIQEHACGLVCRDSTSSSAAQRVQARIQGGLVGSDGVSTPHEFQSAFQSAPLKIPVCIRF